MILVRFRKTFLKQKCCALSVFFKSANLTNEIKKLKDTHWEKALSSKTSALAKSRNMGLRVIGKSNQIFILCSKIETIFFKE